MGHTVENRKVVESGTRLEGWVTLLKMGHTMKNRSHFEKWVTLWKIDHT